MFPEIKLLKGSHKDTGQTGQGCFMNVIAYLNNEPVITDKSACVCVTVRPIAIWLNDFMTGSERPQLLPYILRAMGSVTDDRDELVRRAWLCAEFATKCAENARLASRYMICARPAADTSAYNAWSSRSFARIGKSALAAEMAASAAENGSYAEMVASVGSNKWRSTLISAALKLLDAMLPAATEPQAIYVERLEKLRTLASVE